MRDFFYLETLLDRPRQVHMSLLLCYNEDYWYIFEKEDDPQQTPETPYIVFQIRIHLLLEIAFCERGR